MRYRLECCGHEGIVRAVSLENRFGTVSSHVDVPGNALTGNVSLINRGTNKEVRRRSTGMEINSGYYADIDRGKHGGNGYYDSKGLLGLRNALWHSKGRRCGLLG